VSDDHWIQSQRRRWSLPSLLLASCNVLLAGAPKATIDKFQRLLNAAARLVSDTRKFNRRLRQLMHVDLQWLDVPERVKFKFKFVSVHNSLQSSQDSPVLDGLTDSDLQCGQSTTSGVGSGEGLCLLPRIFF